MPPLAMRAKVSPGSLNEERRTVDLVWTTGERVLRQPWFGEDYYEELSLDPKHVVLDRLNNGAPLLNAHSSYDLGSVIGVVESARLEKGLGVATVRFPKAEDDAESDAIFRKVKDGIIRNVSVGYRVHKLEKVEDGEGEVPILRATSWTPYEISMVPIGADAGAGVRSEGVQTNPCEFVVHQERSMAVMKPTKKKRSPQGGTQPAAAPAARADDGDAATEEEDDAPAAEGATEEEDDDAPAAEGDAEAEAERSLREAGAAAERRRTAALRRIARTLATPEEFVERHIQAGTRLGAFRAEALREYEKRTLIQTGSGRIDVGPDARDKFRRCAADWLLQRSGQAGTIVEAGRKRGEAVKLDPGEVRGMTLLRLAEDCVHRAGVNTRGMDPLRISELAFDTRAGGFNTTSDFPLIIDEVVNRTLLANYELAEDTWRKLAKVGSVSDFKPSARIRLGTLGRLDRVPEHAEFKNKPIPDGVSEMVQVETFGNIFAVTRQVVVNDDLGAIVRLLEDTGRAAGHTIELEFWDLLNLNTGLGPLMADGKTLFHVDHGNIQAGGLALGVAGLDANRQLLATQTDPSGNLIVMRPHTLLVSTVQGMAARNFNTSEYDIDEGDGVTPNGVRGLFEEVIDSPRITSPRRYIFADPQRNPTFEVNFLNGQQVPFTESRDGWRIDGKEYKVRHDFGVNAVDYRTAITDDGTP